MSDLEKQVNMARMSLDDNNHDSDTSSCSDCESSEEEGMCDQPVKGLFCDQVFASVKDLFKHEAEVNKFNIVRLVQDYQMTMFDYIKLVNFIRREKPQPSLFEQKFDNLAQVPWNDEAYLKVEIEDDPLLQFDVEEDLDMLDIPLEINNNNQSEQSKELAYLKKRLEQAEAKIEELVEINDKLKTISKNLLTNSTSASKEKDSISDDDDSTYRDSYSNYSIHLEMLQDKVRTEGYMNAILDNKDVFKDKVVLDVGCGTGILSMFAAKAGAKLVIAVDMSDIIGKAIEIAKENDLSQRIVYLKGKVEEVKLPVDKVDIIISEWMGYFLLFESMLDSVLFARDKYLKPDGLVLPNFFEMHLFGVNDSKTHDHKIKFWSNVYGFKMNCMRNTVATDGQVLTIEPESVVTDLFKFKEIECLKCRVDDISEFENDFVLSVKHDTNLTGLAVSFDTFFNHSSLHNKSSFSTSPFHTPTHWEQTLFQFQEPIQVKEGSKLSGKMKCYKNPDYLRSYIVEFDLLGQKYIFKVE